MTSKRNFTNNVKKTKSLLILILAFIGVTAMNNVNAQTVVASGDCGENGNNLTWILTSDSVLTISGSGAMKDWTSSVNPPWYNYRTRMKTLVIGSSVTTIGNFAFAGAHLADYYNLTGQLTIPNSITKIGHYAFDICLKLTGTLTIPNYVTTVGQHAFGACGFTSLTIGNSVTVVDNGAFISCSALTSVTIGNSVAEIRDEAFDSCVGLTSVTIPNSVILIGSHAFWQCKNLTNITIPSSVILIGQGAFGITPWYNNKPDGIIYINNVLYEYKGTMPSGTTINIKDGTISISPDAFYMESLTGDLVIPNSVIVIGRWAFSFCNITSLTVGSSVIAIGAEAFKGCYDLTSITSYAINPPEIYLNAFSGVTKSIPVSVPCVSETTYKQTDGWKDFTNYTNCVTTGLNDIIKTSNIILYPNPATTELHIKFETQEAVDYTIFNVSGQIIMQGKLQENQTINIESLSKGMYYLKISGIENAMKFVKN